MSRGDSDSKALVLARQQLGDPTVYQNFQTLLDAYLLELKDHLSYDPEAKNFTIRLEPRTGFGVVKCLVFGCHQSISLTKRIGVRDGGKSVGLGSLSAYRAHMQRYHNDPPPSHPQPNTSGPSTPKKRPVVNPHALTPVKHQAIRDLFADSPCLSPLSPIRASPSSQCAISSFPDLPATPMPPRKRPATHGRSLPAKRARAEHFTPPKASALNVKLEPTDVRVKEENSMYVDIDDSDDDVSGPLRVPRFPLASVSRHGHQPNTPEAILRAGDDELLNGEPTVEGALRQLGLETINDRIPGMEVSLLAHQVVGTAWMLARERRGKAHSGINADEPGLGKTVQLLALMVKNPPQTRRPTLIIVPPCLLEQWQLEIHTKTSVGFTVHLYHGKNKAKTSEELGKFDIVLTTYMTMALEWPDPNKYPDSGNPGLLSLVRWYRIVLDEAQYIRNKDTRTSRAAAALKAEVRWCLTGTPIMNTLADAYGLLRFLRASPCHWDEFFSLIVKPEKTKPEASARHVRAIFQHVLIRRKKNSRLQGEPIIVLPTRTVEIIRLSFTQEEWEVYQMVEKQSQAIFNKYLQAGTVLKNYFKVLAALLRLRQVCSHPALMLERGVAFTSSDGDDNAAIRDHWLAHARHRVSSDFVQNLKKKYMAIARARQTEAPAEPSATQDQADIEREADEVICPMCDDAFTDPVVTACEHVFCTPCINNLIDEVYNRTLLENPDAAHLEAADCPTCDAPVRKSHHFPRWVFEPTEAELARDEDPGAGVPGSQGQRAGFNDNEQGDSGIEEEGVQDDEENAAVPVLRRTGNGRRAIRPIIMDDEDDMDDEIIHGAKPANGQVPATGPQKRFLPSTKMKRMMDLIETWRMEAPDEKILIISQWTQCLLLVSEYLTEYGYLHVKYQGDMNQAKRSQSIRVFMSKEKASIMLMSLKAGGVGLNLTRANRVINLDLGWNLAVEDQAYDRVHRMGQTRPVLVQRLVIENTVEDRILAMQQRKQALADGALGDLSTPTASSSARGASGAPRGLRGGGVTPADRNPPGVPLTHTRLDVEDFIQLFGVDNTGRSLSRPTN